jgi:hypothetical protein
MTRRLSLGLLLLGLAGCAASPPLPAREPPRAARPRPCFTIHNDSDLRAKDARRTVDELARHIQLGPEDEAVKSPRSLADVQAILRRDTVYLFAAGAAYSRGLDTLEGRLSEATLELLLGESQLVASQVLSTQEAWVGADLRIARASLATEGAQPSTDRGRMLAQLIRVVEEGNKLADALGIVAPEHLVRGAEVIRRVRKEAPTDPRTFELLAEYHRLRGEWAEFEAAMRSAEATDRTSPALCYLRGMEQLERFRRPDLGAAAMRECVKRFPRFVRAQAGLVLMATTPTDRIAELERLRATNGDHYLVMLLEPTLAADQELMRIQESGAADAR